MVRTGRATPVRSRPEALRVIADGFTFLDGPRWHDGVLFVSDFHTGAVYAVDEETGARQVCHVPGTPSGLGFSPDNELMVVSMTENAVYVLDASSGKLALHADLGALQAGQANDMLVDRQGRAYVGCDGFDEDAGEPIRPAPLALVGQGSSTSIVAHGLLYPNGMALSLDGETLYVAETLAARISAFHVGAGGALSNRRVWAAFGVESSVKTVPEAISTLPLLPDGLALDVLGGIWVGDANGHGVSRMLEGGVVTDWIDTGELAVYAVALGGDDLRTLFLCAAPPLSARERGDQPHATLLACRVRIPGVPTN